MAAPPRPGLWRWYRRAGHGFLLAWLLACVQALCLPGLAMAQPAPVLRLEAGQAGEAWPAVQWLVEAPGQPLSLAAVRQRGADWAVPNTAWANLGPHREPVWLRLPLQVPGEPGTPQAWVFDIDYPSLREVEVYLLRDGQLVQQARLGASLRFDERPLPSRTPAVMLQLTPGAPHELLLRVHSASALVLPMAFSTPAQFQAREARRQLVQGLLAGVALALLVYSLAHWVSLRNRLFAFYALMLVGTSVFFLHLYGIGQQHLWPDAPWLQAWVSPLAVLLALAAAGPFVAQSLDTRRHCPWLHRGLLGLAGVAALTLAAGLSGVLSYGLLRLVASAVGLPLALLAALASWQVARQGDRAARWMLLGWSTYLLGGLSVVGLLFGLLPATLWTLHAFQAGWLIEIIAWLRVLGLHIEGVRRQAERAELEKQALLTLAHTDALTGLPNRRGLNLALDRALQQARPDGALAVFLLDLDGFKPVNDRLGHDVGDALLVAVGGRLRATLRGSDLVARLGGDEFVIVAAGLNGEGDALALGRKLLRAFDAPFDLDGQFCRVGLTIGFSLAPHDGQEPGDLLRRADAAMYAGKQAGRHCVRRGGASAGLAAG